MIKRKLKIEIILKKRKMMIALMLTPVKLPAKEQMIMTMLVCW
ncbi:hypothetical protein [Fusibacter paucivorans]|nr:hypothetical protein [Fusibacter paucivorans]